MENNFHSTKELWIDRHPSYGSRILVKHVKNAITKNGSFATIVFPTTDVKDGDVYRKFFEMLDKGECKSKQGAILKCDKKLGYYFDVSNAFPKGITFSSARSTDETLCFSIRTADYENGTKEVHLKNKTVSFDKSAFPGNTSIVQKAHYIKDNISIVKTKDGFKLFEYAPGRFDKIPDVKTPLAKKFPKSIDVLKIDSALGKITFKLKFDNVEDKTYTIDAKDSIPMNLHKSLYAFYIAKFIGSEYWINSDNVQLNYATGNYKLVNKPVEKPVEKPVIAKIPKIIADPTSDAAKELIGKRVIGSLSYSMIIPVKGILTNINLDRNFPFEIQIGDSVESVAFIKEAPEPKYVCYAFEDAAVRHNLMLKIFKDEPGLLEEAVVSFKNVEGRWLLNGKITATQFLKEYCWIDGSKCGTLSTED